jgi:flavin reductase (DIM6/NTAB) family NADH-FMN oxidoreductase RutF
MRSPDTCADGSTKEQTMDEAWIPVLGKMRYGIYVLTTAHEGRINGMIASWVSQVSYAPPLVCVAVHPSRRSHAMIEQSGRFALNLLAGDQKDLISKFKGPDPAAKFESLHWSGGATGCPILQDGIGFIECDVKAAYTPGNHTLFIGEIRNAGLLRDHDPLTTGEYKGLYLGDA